jgi:hypothetical protein
MINEHFDNYETDFSIKNRKNTYFFIRCLTYKIDNLENYSSSNKSNNHSMILKSFEVNYCKNNYKNY